MVDSWTEVIQGTKTETGDCAYSFGVSQSIDNATPHVAWVAAVDPATCQFEILYGVPTAMPYSDGGDLDADDEEAFASDLDCAAVAEEAAEAGEADAGPCGDLANARMGGNVPGGTSPQRHTHNNKQATVQLHWQDYEGFETSRTRARVKSTTSGSTITSGGGGYARWWLTETGWRREGSGYWYGHGLEVTSSYVAEYVNAHYYNDDFPLCSDRADIYVDQLVAEVTISQYNYWAGNTWTTGPNCVNLLEYYIAWYPGEYW